MGFRDFLLLSGVTESDIREAVRDARKTTRHLAHLAGVAETILEKAEARLIPGKKGHKVVTVARKVAGTIRESAYEMVNERSKKR
jgi:hypothetical protein